MTISKPQLFVANPNFFADLKRWEEDGEWIPASGGTETPFMTRSGARLLYCYQPRSGNHAYLDCGSDMILTFEEASNIMGVS